VTADDFGMSVEVNEAVEEAHRSGILTCASLVVSGAAAADAVARARRMPRLGIGLHLALVAAPPTLHPALVPALVDARNGELSHSPGRVGFQIAVLRRVRAQARAEIRAQFEAWRQTGLPLDHVDGHWHFHQHPSVMAMLMELAPSYGIRAVRVPFEPPISSWRAAGFQGFPRRLGDAVPHGLLAAGMRRTLRRHGIANNDWFFGKVDGGRVDRERLLGFIAHLPEGVSEIGLHPATRSWPDRHAPPSDWQATAELAALTDPDVAEACRVRNIPLIRFADVSPPAART
jgi:chitin disaccharide deacetylase